MSKPFLYDIDFVVNTDYPETDKEYNRAGTEYNMDCPFCGHHKKLNVNLKKNVFSCPACNTQGGMLELHRLAKHFSSRAEAKHDLDKIYKSLSDKEKDALTRRKNAVQTESVHVQDTYDLKERNRVQSAFAAALPVNDRFKEELHSEERGSMKDEDIRRLGYASFDPERTIRIGETDLTPAEFAFYSCYGRSASTPKEYISRLVKFLKERKSTGIPGFYIDGEHIRAVSMNDGEFDLLPVRCRHGEISFFQTKFPKLPENASPEQKAEYIKYGRYSTSREFGCSTAGLLNIHYTSTMRYTSEQKPKTVFLTEGILKADIAAELYGRPFIALVGISAYNQLAGELAYLKEHGTQNIVIATDMDYDKNPNVAKALAAIREIIKNSGLVCMEAEWDHRYKGIDDILIARQKDPSLRIMVKRL